jgi:hypothetical protein
MADWTVLVRLSREPNESFLDKSNMVDDREFVE